MQLALVGYLVERNVLQNIRKSGSDDLVVSLCLGSQKINSFVVQGNVHFLRILGFCHVVDTNIIPISDLLVANIKKEKAPTL